MRNLLLIYFLIFETPLKAQNQIQYIDTPTKSMLIVSKTETSLDIDFHSHFPDFKDNPHGGSEIFVSSVKFFYNKLEFKLNEYPNKFIIECTSNFDTFLIREVGKIGIISNENKIKIGSNRDSFEFGNVRFYTQNYTITVMAGNTFIRYFEPNIKCLNRSTSLYLQFDYNHCGIFTILSGQITKNNFRKIKLEISGVRNKKIFFLKKIKYKIRKLKFK